MIVITGGLKKVFDYLQQKHNDYFLFELAYVPNDSGSFREIDRFIQESVAQRAHFQNEYVGPAAIDITQWCTNAANTYFDAFLFYLADRYNSNDKNKIILFADCKLPQSIIAKLEKIFDSCELINLYSKAEHTPDNLIGFSA